MGRGAKVFELNCMTCHGVDGAGYVPISQQCEGAGLAAAPALWGDKSFNNGAGTGRVLSASAFIKHSMPSGINWTQPTLTDEDAFDVAGFINAQPRPQMEELEKTTPT